MISRTLSQLFRFSILLAVVTLPKLATGHEYWIEPHMYTVPLGTKLQGDLANGQNFKGLKFPYIGASIDSFTLTNANGTEKYTNRDGDTPAFDIVSQVEGLNIASYQGKFDILKFKTWEKFTEYVEDQGLDGIAERHVARGLAETDFSEQYARCAKALFQVGEPVADQPAGNDQLTGLKFELVANANPYTFDENQILPVTLYWEGKPIANKQIKVFASNGELKTMILRTDANGKVLVPLSGGGKFMLNAVHMIDGDNDPDTKTTEWQSYWASLVFGIKGTDALLLKVKEKTAAE